MTPFYIEGVGLCGPGMAGWAASRPMLAGDAEYVPAETAPPPSSLLPPNERRRAVQIVKLALAVAGEAFEDSGCDPATTASVFTSSGGDGETIHAIMRTLASEQRELSPTRFHNSVHNTAAGYWSIQKGATAASTSICAHDDSFAAGLLEAAAQLRAGEPSVALIAYDVRYPSPLAEVRPVGSAFAAAFVFSARPGAGTLGRLELALAEPAAPTPMPKPALETLRGNTPAARCLPLLAAMASGGEAALTLDYLGDMALRLRFSPEAAQ